MTRKLNFLAAAFAAAVFVLPAQAAFIDCPPEATGAARANLTGSAFGGNFGSPSGFGDATVRWNNDGTATFTINTFGVRDVNSAAIHRASDNQVLLNLTDSQNVFRDGRLERTVTVNQTLADQIMRSPGDFFVQVGSPQFPAGALRGNLGINRFLGGDLRGANVVGGTQSQALGGFNASLRNDAQGRLFLDLDLTAQDVDSTFTRLNLLEGPAGEQGQSRLVLGENLQLQDGRLRRSIELDDALARDLVTRPQDFSIQGSTAEFPSGAFRGQFGWSNEVFVPVYGAIQGAMGSNWNSDLRVFNTSYDRTATVVIEYFPRGGGADASERLTSVTVEPRGTAFFTDVANLLPGNQGIGALRLTSNTRIAVTARVFNDLRPEGGTFGQVIPGLSRCAAISRGVLGGITNAADSDLAFQARTNVGFFNPSGENVTVRLLMTDSGGDQIAARAITLGPWQQTQMPLFAPQGGLFEGQTNLEAGTLSFHASAPVFGYGSVVDNATGDATTLFPQLDNAFPQPQN